MEHPDPAGDSLGGTGTVLSVGCVGGTVTGSVGVGVTVTGPVSVGGTVTGPVGVGVTVTGPVSVGGTVTGPVSVGGTVTGPVVGVGGTVTGPVVGVGGCTVRLTTSTVSSNRLLSNVKLSSPSEDGISADSAEVRLSVGREVGGAILESSNNMPSIPSSPVSECKEWVKIMSVAYTNLEPATCITSLLFFKHTI